MTRAGRATLIAASAIGIAAAGAGAGAGLYASLEPSSSTTTVVSVPASDGLPVSATTGLSINEIYKRSVQSVVDITVTSGSSYSPFGGTSATLTATIGTSSVHPRVLRIARSMLSSVKANL